MGAGFRVQRLDKDTEGYCQEDERKATPPIVGGGISSTNGCKERNGKKNIIVLLSDSACLLSSLKNGQEKANPPQRGDTQTQTL